MNDFMTIKEAASLWHLTERRVSALCKDGKIQGAIKQGRAWTIPINTKKPLDSRVKSGKYKKHIRPANLPLPIGISDYRIASTEYYYVDKTMMIKDFIDERPMVSLFARPRRFGKTLNMDMLRTFFEKTDEDTSVYFTDKKIWSCGEKYRGYQGKYPVIFLSFKDIKFDSWDSVFSAFKDVLIQEAHRHINLDNSSKCDEYDKKKFRQLISGNMNEVELSGVLLILSRMLHNHYDIAPIIIIDEYDTPIQHGYGKHYYDKIILFMRNLFSGGLNDNKHLSYGFLSGILTPTKESVLNELNNLTINSVFDNKYSSYFGFTEEEISEMLKYYGATEKFNEICQWYGSYQFGKTITFNPWSVINYFNSECEPRSFWQHTGNNNIISKIVAEADKEICETLTSLLNGKILTTYIDPSVIYPKIKSNSSSIYSFLIVTGYLKILTSTPSFNGDFMCEVSLPNKEISLIYHKEIIKQLENIISPTIATSIQEAIFSENNNRLKQLLQTLIIQAVNTFDDASENFCHYFMLGLCALLGDSFLSYSKESSDDRYDISLVPVNKRLPGILFGIKAEKNCSGKQLKKMSETALKQIADKKYDIKMEAEGIKTIYKFGIAFSENNTEITIA